MADEFKSYDKTPIFSRLNINGWRCGLKELVHVTVCGLLLVLVLIFVSLYGNAQSQIAEDSRASASAIVGNTYCTDKSCLKTAARVLELMNRSVDPCDNFYEFACGNYKIVKPVLTDAGPRSVLNDLYTENQDRIMGVLEKPISQMHDYASERKLKEFFQSCNDKYSREKLRGTPFLSKVLPELGGWKLLGTWDAAWDFNTALKKVHADFWVDALFSPSVQVDPYDLNRRTIELAPGGVGRYMAWNWYMNPRTEKIRQDYKKFIRRVGSLLQRDAVDAPLKNASLQDTYLEEFVNDTFSIEMAIASIASQARYEDDPYDEMNKVSLSDLSSETGGVINWLTQVGYIFNKAVVTGSTKVVVVRKEYFRNITDMIMSLPESDRNRMLHNYLIWRVLEVYVQDMSWEYVHANREIYEDIYNRQDFSGVYRYCFRRASFYLSDALSSLFVKEHFTEDSRKWVTDITTNIKLALLEQLENTPWLDKETKTYARQKLDLVTFKMGYPDWVGNMAAVDQVYMSLSINASDYFGNLLNANQFTRADWNEQLMSFGEGREEWYYPAFSTVIGLYWYWNEVIAPAGILQSPIYHREQPHFSTFGSLGSILGRFLHHVVDEWGKFYDKAGDYTHPHSWWSNSSLESYKKIRECVLGVYKNVTQTIILPNGAALAVGINAEFYTPIAISWTNGIRLSQIGYKDWLRSKGIGEKILPGVDLTNQQMVYLSHAQTFCYSGDKRISSFRGRRGGVTEDIQVNMALGQLKEFSEAFNCKPESKMSHSTKCDYY